MYEYTSGSLLTATSQKLLACNCKSDTNSRAKRIDQTCHYYNISANNPRFYNNYTKIKGHKNIRSSNCTVLVKVM